MRAFITILGSAVIICACSPETARPDVVVGQQTQGALVLEPLEPAAIDDALDAFAQWHSTYAQATAAKQAAMVARGQQLLTPRARAMLTLIQADPARALSIAMHPAEREGLPPSMQPLIEQWVDGVGALNVVAGTGVSEEAPEVQRFVSLAGSTDSLRAFITGPRFASMSRPQVRLHGVSLGGLIALSDRPTRLLFPGETPKEGLPWKSASRCPVSRKQIAVDQPVVNAGDSLYGVCTADHTAALDDQLATDEDSVPTPGSAWSTGPKTILFIRVDFDDLTGDPVSQASAQSLIDTQVNNYYVSTSYNQTTVSTTVTPTFRLPQPKTYYQTNENYFGLRADALNAAHDAGFNEQNYSLDIVGFKGIYSGWAGRGSVGSRGVWFNGYFDLRVSAHEIGHNYGLWHSNYWAASGNSIIGSGTNQEYGNPFDTMGLSGDNNHHFNAWFKRELDWFSAAESPTVTSSGTYRIQQIELPISSGLHAIKVPRGDNNHDYWLEFRQAFGSNKSLSNGTSINWGYQYNTGSHLLDMTPWDGDRGDSALTYGRTFSDTNYGIHLTPLRKGGTTPESLDVVVNLGQFPGNRAPTATLAASTTTPAVNAMVTFTATATDPDGDALAYAWSFGDDEYYPSGPSVTRSFSSARTVFARVTVSDMKGQVVTKSVVVTVGAPTDFTLTGTVEAGGQSVEGVRITDGTRESFTDSAGVYLITGVPAGSFTLTAMKRDYTFMPSFAVPVTVSASQTGLDFTGTVPAGYSVSGRAFYYPDAGIGGVTVTDGTHSTTTAANGNFALTGVPNGAYTVTATKPGWVFTPRPNIEVLGGNVSGVVLQPSGTSLSGQITGVTASASVTDGVRTVASNGNGANWYYSINYVANGSYNVAASLPGYTLTPTFANPVVVAGVGRGGLGFTATVGQSYLVSGTVTTGGTALPGVVVSDGTRSSTTDSLGRFVLMGVPAGSYTLTPTRSGITFVPATRMVTVASVDVPSQDFSTTVVNPPPTVVNGASATPNPVVTGSTTLLKALGADDSGEAQLTYTWTTSSSPAPSLSANGTNAAKNTTATFTRAGTYPFEVAITDPGGLTVRSNVSVVVQQTLTAMVVAPLSANVLTGATQQFSAQGRDQYGQFIYDGPYTWAVSGGGAISVNGLFTAGATPGGPFTVTVTSASGRTGTATVTVTAAGAPVITRVGASPNPVTGVSAVLSVTATDDGGEAALTYTWSRTVGPAVSFSGNGDNAAKNATVTFTQAGTYQLLVTVLDGTGNMATAVLDLEVLQTPTAIEVQPPSVTLQPGATQTFTATVDDQFGTTMAQQPTLTWTASGGGTIDDAGLFTAAMMPGGPYTVTATTGALSGSTTVTIMAMPDTRAPVVSIVTPIEGTHEEVSFTAKVEASDDVGVVGVALTLDGTLVSELVAAPFEWPIDVASLANGTHILNARARDAAGNTTDAPAVHFTVGVVTMDLAPTVTLSVGMPVDGVVAVAIVGTDDVAVMTLQLEVDGVVTQTAAVSPWNVNVPLSVGSHELQAVAIDTAGQQGRSEKISVTIAAAGEKPTPPTLVGHTCGCSSGVGPLGLLALLLVRRSRRKSR